MGSPAHDATLRHLDLAAPRPAGVGVMGYDRHNAIIVSARHPRPDGTHWADYARAAAERIFNQEEEPLADAWEVVSPVLSSPVNDVRSFFVAPDGSKEGWPTSDLGDARRAQFIVWLEAQRYEDLSSPIQWAEVQYGDDDRETIVVRDSDEGRRELEDDDD